MCACIHTCERVYVFAYMCDICTSICTHLCMLTVFSYMVCIFGVGLKVPAMITWTFLTSMADF